VGSGVGVWGEGWGGVRGGGQGLVSGAGLAGCIGFF
jgi:hypothetical protein